MSEKKKSNLSKGALIINRIVLAALVTFFSVFFTTGKNIFNFSEEKELSSSEIYAKNTQKAFHEFAEKRKNYSNRKIENEPSRVINIEDLPPEERDKELKKLEELDQQLESLQKQLETVNHE